MKVNVGVSNRHVHLTKETYEQLFKEELKPLFPLSQKNEYASDKTVTLKGPKGKIDNVRILGPFRSYNQVEVSNSDAYLLGINPPVRKSGDLKQAEKITIYYQDKEITLEESCILAQTHLHLNPTLAKELNVKDGQKVKVHCQTEREGILIAHVKVKDNGVLDLHIDKDQANAFLLKNHDEVEVEL